MFYNKAMRRIVKDCCDPCNKCNNNTCNSCCGGCKPVQYDCDFDIQADPFDESKWVINWCGRLHKITIPDRGCIDINLSTDYSSARLNLSGSDLCDTSSLTGEQVGDIINLDDLRNVEIDTSLEGSCYELVYHKDIDCGEGCTSPKDHWANFNIHSENIQQDGIAYLRGAGEDGCPVYLAQPESCSMLVFDPTCLDDNRWKAYSIPDAEGDAIEPDTDGYYRVLTKNDCGCVTESKLPVLPTGMTVVDYQRDSVPDDPDFPWYYGNYNDHINLHLEDNASEYFGKYPLKVTVHYGVQAIKSDHCPNYNWRSLVVPVVGNESVRVTTSASILQNWAMTGEYKAGGNVATPWGSTSLRGTITFIVPKGKEAYLHHEYRVRTANSFPNYYTGAWDGQKVPAAEATLNAVLHPASRLNSLQVIIEPTQGSSNYTPVTDPERDQLDPAVDSYNE